jgi:hypothetical protein
MAIEYKCSQCGAMTRRDLLVAKKVLFTGMGAGAKTHRARTIAHLCITCTRKDPQYSLPPYTPISKKLAATMEVDEDATA